MPNSDKKQKPETRKPDRRVAASIFNLMLAYPITVEHLRTRQEFRRRLAEERAENKTVASQHNI